MTTALLHNAKHKYLEVQISGKLTKEDYDAFVPRIEELIAEHGKIRLLVSLDDFDGWSGSALWQDLKFDWDHYNDIERLAMVGDSRWLDGMATFCKPFTTAEIKTFEQSEIGAAREWLAQD